MTSLLPTLYSALEAKYNDDRGDSVHISDLVLCPREVVFRRLQPQKINNTTLGFFVFGESAGAAIQALVKSDPERWSAEHEITYEGISAHIDLYDKKLNIPIEVKTANMADMEQPKPHYTQQLRYYMAITGATTGIILVFLTQHFKSPKKAGPFREWIITMTEAQVEQEREKLRHEKTSFEAALLSKKPALARHVMNDKDYNWKCTWCAFLNECQQMNRKEGVGG